MGKIKKILVVQNPVSGARRLNYVRKIIDELRVLGADVKIYFTTAASDATEYLKTVTDEYDLIVIAGGDGTVNEAINGMMNKQTPLGVIPAGTANVLAKELGMPTAVKKLARVLIAGNSKPVYLSQINGRRFSLCVGCGFDAWVVRDVNLKIKKVFGKLAYFLSMIKCIHLYGSRQFTVEIDGKNYHGQSVIILNGRLYAGQFILSRHGDLSRPELQVMIISASSKLQLIGYLFPR